MQTISIINYKGGVGKTSIAANLAVGFANKGYRVLVIDLDPQASLTFSFMKIVEWETKYRDKQTIKNWYDAYLNKKKVALETVFIKDIAVNEFIKENPITLISSHIDLFKIEIELAQKLVSKSGGKRGQARNKLEVLYVLAKELNAVYRQFDVVILDCPPSFEMLTQSAVIASDYYLVPTRLDYLSSIGGHTLNGHIEELIEMFNERNNQFTFNYPTIKIELLGTVMTMIQTKKEELIKINEQYKKEFMNEEFKGFETKIRFNQTVMGEENQIPIILRTTTNNQENELANEFQDLLREVEVRMGVRNGCK